MRHELTFWKRVFSNWEYTFLALVVAFLFYALNVFIANFSSLLDFSSNLGFFGTIKFFLSLIIGFKEIIKASSYYSLIIISLMLGMLFSLIFYRAFTLNGNGNKKFGVMSGLGILLGSFAPGCAACGIGLASVLGLSGAFLVFLPLKGLELSLLAIIILAIAIFKTSKDSCKIMLNKKVKGGKRK